MCDLLSYIWHPNNVYFEYPDGALYCGCFVITIQGILLAQVVNSLIIKIQDIAISASLAYAIGTISEIATGKIPCWTGKTQEIRK